MSGRQAVSEAAQRKLERLQSLLREMGRVVVAYSGGVDSAFLLRVAVDVLGDQALGVIGRSPSLAERERQEALRLAESMGARVEEIETRELEDPRYTANPVNRCYFCKTELFRRLRVLADERGIPYVLDGSNRDDEGDWRPGMQAAAEQGVRSPLREAGLTKAEIRQLSRQLGLPTWDKPAAACLASRIPFGAPVTVESLSRIERAEAWLKDRGLKQVRVRHHDGIARIEVAPEEMDFFADPQNREETVAALRALGYRYVALDLAGYRRGSFNPGTAATPAAADSVKVKMLS